MIRPLLLLILGLNLIACSDSNDNRSTPPAPPPPPPDFSEADAWLEDFVATEELFDGASIAIVEKGKGAIHKSVFGDHTEDTVVLLASTSKVPSVTLLMALHEDDASVDFDIQAPITDYLPWLGVWDPAITTEHLVSNRSGLPGLVYVFTQQADYLAHGCQFFAVGNLMDCVQTIFTTPLPNLPSTPANTAFEYGGSQWQLSGGVAELVGGGTWNQLWDQYIAEPCDLETATYGNMSANPTDWDGNPDSLPGRDNPSIEGGMITDLDDYAKILALHVDEGACGDNQVLSPEGLAFMREERTPAEGENRGYGMGWWSIPPKEDASIYLYVDPGLFGSVSWIDTDRGYGGVVLFEEYTFVDASIGSQAVVDQLIPIIEQAIDAVR
jgi:CubicO group peptidase (beta-lactamase class C family)